MTRQNLTEVLDRIHAVTRQRPKTGNADADSILHSDALLVALEYVRRAVELKAISTVLGGALPSPNADLVVHAQDVVEALDEARTTVTNLEQALRRANAENTAIRRELAHLKARQEARQAAATTPAPTTPAAKLRRVTQRKAT